MAEQTVLEAYTAIQNQLVIYQLVLMFTVVALVILVVIFMPMIPWAISKMLTKKTLIAVMDKTRTIRIKGGFSLRNGMYHNKERNLYFVKKYPGVYNLSGVPIDFCQIDMGFVQHPEYNKFIAELKRMGYPSWKEIETALEFNTIPKDDTDTIEQLGFKNYDEAQKKLNPEKLTKKSEILAPYFASCPLDELIGYGADVPPASIAGEIDDVVLSQKSPQMSTLMNMMPYAIVIVVLLVGGALAYKIVS